MHARFGKGFWKSQIYPFTVILIKESIWRTVAIRSGVTLKANQCCSPLRKALGVTRKPPRLAITAEPHMGCAGLKGSAFPSHAVTPRSQMSLGPAGHLPTPTALQK